MKHQYNQKLLNEFFSKEDTDFKEENNGDLYLNKSKKISVYGYFSKNLYCRRIKLLNDYMSANIDTTLKDKALPLCLRPTLNNDLASRY